MHHSATGLLMVWLRPAADISTAGASHGSQLTQVVLSGHFLNTRRSENVIALLGGAHSFSHLSNSGGGGTPEL